MTRAVHLTAWVLLTAAAASAQPSPEPAAIAITLQDAIDRGLATSHRLAEASARGDALQAVVAQRHAAQLPLIAGRASYVRTNHVEEFGILLPNNRLRIIYPDVPDNYQARLDLQWPIYNGGRFDALERAARAEADAAAGDLAAARADLRLEITRAYWALVTATQSLRVVDQSVERMGAHLADVRNQLSAGLVSPSDVLAVEAQASRQRMISVQTRSLRDAAQEQLAYLIGAPAGSSIDPTSALETASAESVPGEDASADAQRQRAERLALTARLAAAGERAKAALAGHKPTIAIGGGVDYARPNSRIFPRQAAWQESWDAGINVSWPIFDGGRANAETSEALAMQRAATERLAEFNRSLELEVRQRSHEATASRAAIVAAEDAVRAATEARRVIGEHFTAGVATNTDVIDAQLALLQADLDRTQALAAARLADARLARALGQ